MSSYDYKEEFGSDPFGEYSSNEALKARLVAAIPTAIEYAVHRPKDPRVPNTKLLELSKQLSDECSQDQSTPLSPHMMGHFWRVCALPDPVYLEERRLQFIETEREQEFIRNNPPTPEQLAEKYAAAIATHSGGWTYHDHECICSRYFDDYPCPRGGHVWSCCGSTTHESICSKERK